MEEEFKDKFNNTIRLTGSQWDHIVNEHPEIKPYKDRIPDVLINPDVVKRSKRNEDTFLYNGYYKDIYEGKYLLAVADIRNKKLLLTCYITDRIKQGDTIWKKD